MSGIAKPFVDSSTAINNEELIPVDHVVGMDKVSTKNPNQPLDDQFEIHFQMKGEGHTMVKKLRYTTETIRNTAFTAIKTAISTQI